MENVTLVTEVRSSSYFILFTWLRYKFKYSLFNDKTLLLRSSAEEFVFQINVKQNTVSRKSNEHFKLHSQQIYKLRY